MPLKTAYFKPLLWLKPNFLISESGKRRSHCKTMASSF
jgi:hypothetical protein